MSQHKEDLYHFKDQQGLLRIRAMPGASQEKIKGVYTDPEGRGWLRVYVSEPADKGKANKAVLAYLAKVLDLPKTDLSIDKGKTDRNKVVMIQSPPKDIEKRIETLLLMGSDQHTLALF